MHQRNEIRVNDIFIPLSHNHNNVIMQNVEISSEIDKMLKHTYNSLIQTRQTI